jgi:hypothetical protein
MSGRTGQLGSDSKQKEAKKGQPGKTGRIGQPRRDCQETTVSKSQTGQDRTAGIRQLEKDNHEGQSRHQLVIFCGKHGFLYIRTGIPQHFLPVANLI